MLSQHNLFLLKLPLFLSVSWNKLWCKEWNTKVFVCCLIDQGPGNIATLKECILRIHVVLRGPWHQKKRQNIPLETYIQRLMCFAQGIAQCYTICCFHKSSQVFLPSKVNLPLQSGLDHWVFEDSPGIPSCWQLHDNFSKVNLLSVVLGAMILSLSVCMCMSDDLIPHWFLAAIPLWMDCMFLLLDLADVKELSGASNIIPGPIFHHLDAVLIKTSIGFSWTPVPVSSCSEKHILSLNVCLVLYGVLE